MTVETSTATAEDGVNSAAKQPANSAGCSVEQILTPISINKSGDSPTPGFKPPFSSVNEDGPYGGLNVSAVGPTIYELDPYFAKIFGDDGTAFISNCDYNVVINNGTDGNLKKNKNRSAISTIRTQALRGPLILSGWGFDIGDLPVPARQDNPLAFDPNLVSNRAYWKTGPVHLMWDDQRQVWCGGPQILCGVLASDIEAPESPKEPTSFDMMVFRRNPARPGNMADISVDLQEAVLNETITVVNRDPSLSYEGDDPESVFVIAIRLNYEWLPLWVGCPDKV